MLPEILSRDFYESVSATELAVKLLGKVLVTEIDNQLTSGRIVETEAYLQNDPAAHSYIGETARNKSTFGPAGHAYVYFTYGMHYCFNVVSQLPGEAILVRGLVPLTGIDVMQRRRQQSAIVNLCNGPAKLAQALGIDRRFDGLPLISSPIYLLDDGFQVGEIVTTTRIGISKGADAKLRYYLKHNKFVSRL